MQFCPEMLLVGMEVVPHVCGIVVRYEHDVLVWVRRVVVLVISRNLEVFPGFV